MQYIKWALDQLMASTVATWLFLNPLASSSCLNGRNVPWEGKTGTGQNLSVLLSATGSSWKIVMSEDCLCLSMLKEIVGGLGRCTV